MLRATSLDEIVPFAIEGYPPGAVVLDVPDDLPLVHTDPGLLERVVANLVSNAVRHAATGSPVVVASTVVGNDVVLRVVDDGPGVPDDAQGAHVRGLPAVGGHHGARGSDSGWRSPTGLRRPSGRS